MFNCFRQNKIFTDCQFGFIPGDSCVAQILSNIHDIYLFINEIYYCSLTRDIKGIFLNVSNTLVKF